MEPITNKHVEEERLEAYAFNSLGEEEVAAIEEHLLVCVTCQDQLDAVEHHIRAMQGAAKRIREEQIAAPVAANVWDRVRAWLHTPAPIWAGALAMAGVMLVFTLQPVEKPGEPVDVELQAVRGATKGTAEAGHPLRMRLDNRGVPEMSAWRIEIVDEEGAPFWNGTGSWTNTAITTKVDKPFKAGTYFVRLVNGGPDPIREYQLVIEKASPKP